jgi:hypothetical protein
MKVNELLIEGDFPTGSSRIAQFSEELCQYLKDAGHNCWYQALSSRVWSRSTGGRFRDPQHGIEFKNVELRDKAWKDVQAHGKALRIADANWDMDTYGKDAVKIGRFIVSPGSRTVHGGSYLFIQGVDILKNTTIRKHTDVKEDRYEDKWAKEKAAENRVKLKAQKDAERAQRKAMEPPKQPRVKKEKVNLALVWRDVEDAIGISFPDGDPIDHLRKYENSWGTIDMDLIDKAVKMYAGPRTKRKAKYGMYDYLGDMWDSTQGDWLHDANEMLKHKDFRLFDNNEFYDVDNGPDYHDDYKTWDGWDKVKIEPRRNPWK